MHICTCIIMTYHTLSPTLSDSHPCEDRPVIQKILILKFECTVKVTCNHYKLCKCNDNSYFRVGLKSGIIVSNALSKQLSHSQLHSAILG